MISLIEFIERYENSYNRDNCFQSRIEIGEDFESDYLKVKHIHKLMEDICNHFFFNKELYIVLFLWNTNKKTKQELITCGFNYSKIDSIFNDLKISDIKLADNPPNKEVSLLIINKYDFSTIKSIVQAIAGYEILIKPSANISAYFISFGEEYDVLVNLYDDRGIEILTTSQIISNQIENIFFNTIDKIKK